MIVIETEEIQDGGVEVTEMNLAGDAISSCVTRATMGVTRFHPTPSQPEGKGAMTVAGLVFTIAGDEPRPAKFTAPNYQRVVEEAAEIQVIQQRGDGSIGGQTVGGQIAAVVLMLVPTAMIHLDESHAGLSKAPSQ